MKFELKPLSREAIPAALEKADQYRLLNEPLLAESICLDVLEVEAGNQRALVTLLLARTDQFATANRPIDDARALLSGLASEYDRAYYAGIIYERWAHALLRRDTPGSGPIAWDWLRQAMDCYARAEPLRPAGHEEAILRWNTCARTIARLEHVRPRAEEDFLPLLE